MSLKLNEKVEMNFSQVGKIPEFMNYTHKGHDRMEADYIAYDPHRE